MRHARYLYCCIYNQLPSCCSKPRQRRRVLLAVLAAFAFLFSLLRCFPGSNSITRTAPATHLSPWFPALGAAMGAAVGAGWARSHWATRAPSPSRTQCPVPPLPHCRPGGFILLTRVWSVSLPMHCCALMYC